MNRNKALDLIRAIATCMIVNFHFAAENVDVNSFFYKYANGGWGKTGTTLFFLLSGYLLCMKHPLVKDVFRFYRKRWKSVYPMFYITFLISYIYMVLILHTPAGYGGNPLRLSFSLLGIDMYLGFYSVQTYALVGEWFTTIIVLLYVLYPLLALLFQRYRGITTITIFVLYIGNLLTDYFTVPDDANLISGIFYLWVGMLLFAYHEILFERKKVRRIGIALVLIVSVIITFIELPLQELVWKNIFGVLIFLLLYVASDFVERVPGMFVLIRLLAKYSFAIYLTHHFVINQVAPLITAFLSDATPWYLEFAFVWVLTGIYSFVVYHLNRLVLEKSVSLAGTIKTLTLEL